MEAMVMRGLFGGRYSGRRVLLTGHSGFKGSWLMVWLKQLGADVAGYSLEPATDPAHIHLLGMHDPAFIGDINSDGNLRTTFNRFQPEIVFHLAAQPLVRRSYAQPLETFQTNIIGTSNVLEAARLTPSVRAVVNITTDKVYKNHEWPWPYRESDPLGGHDPYSTSKACVELVHESYRKSFFKEAGILSATARAGNVIGGGDWAEDRLIPDVIRTVVRGEVMSVRNPRSVRPWQHVLDPLSGYLLLGQLLLEGKEQFEGSWNFGPEPADCLSVAGVLDEFGKHWTGVRWKDTSGNKEPHESGMLRLDCSKSQHELGWSPVWNVQEAIARTANWYKTFVTNQRVSSQDDLEAYLANAQKKALTWAI